MTPLPRIEAAREEDRAAVESLLAACDLPRDGVRESFSRFLVALDPEGPPRVRRVIGCAGLEVHGRHAVLRSLAVHPDQRGRGVARPLIASVLDSARRAGCSDAWLLTRTVEKMAARHGFARVERGETPPDLLRTIEFTINACASATIMRRAL